MIYTLTVITSGVSGVEDAAGNPLPSNQRTIREINDSDSDGMMDVREYNVARQNPQWGASRWNLSPLSRDSDGMGGAGRSR